MADTVRVTFYLDPDADELLTQRARPRGRGAYISELIRNDKGPLEPGQGVLERIEDKLDNLRILAERL